eukprot:scaffold1220_cov259-Pinguiococcus_pyrenoidosus.AAC.36
MAEDCDEIEDTRVRAFNSDFHLFRKGGRCRAVPQPPQHPRPPRRRPHFVHSFLPCPALSYMTKQLFRLFCVASTSQLNGTSTFRPAGAKSRMPSPS